MAKHGARKEESALKLKAAFLCFLCLILAGCGPISTAPAPKPAPTAPWTGASGVPAFKHVFLLVMENLSFKRAASTGDLQTLIKRYASATSYYASGHPSLPNYLALTSGSTWGIKSDCLFCRVRRPNLGSQLDAANIPWQAYMEGLPSSCWLGPLWPPTGYAGKHNPFLYYPDLRPHGALCHHLKPLSDLTKELQARAQIAPRFIWITPNLCHDGHDCTPAKAAAWLDHYVSLITQSPAWKDGGVLFVTWDEASGADSRGLGPGGQVVPGTGGGHVLTLVIAPGIPPGLKVGVPYDHASLLATIEDGLHLGRLADASTRAPLSAFFSRPSSH